MLVCACLHSWPNYKTNLTPLYILEPSQNHRVFGLYLLCDTKSRFISSCVVKTISLTPKKCESSDILIYLSGEGVWCKILRCPQFYGRIVLIPPLIVARCSDLLRNLHNSTKAMKFLLFVNGLWRCGKMDPIWSGGENFKRSISFTEFGVKIMSHVLFMQFEYPNWSGQIGWRRFDVLQIYNVQLVTKKTETVYGAGRCRQNVNSKCFSIVEWQIQIYVIYVTIVHGKVLPISWFWSYKNQLHLRRKLCKLKKSPYSTTICHPSK